MPLPGFKGRSKRPVERSQGLFSGLGRSEAGSRRGLWVMILPMFLFCAAGVRHSPGDSYENNFVCLQSRMLTTLLYTSARTRMFGLYIPEPIPQPALLPNEVPFRHKLVI
eukprot:337003-Prorocentrum_minimum.AAC.2